MLRRPQGLAASRKSLLRIVEVTAKVLVVFLGRLRKNPASNQTFMVWVGSFDTEIRCEDSNDPLVLHLPVPALP